MVCTLYVYMYMTIITGIVYFMLILFIIYTEGTAYDLTQGVASGPYGRHTILLFIRCIVYTLYCVYYIIALLYAYCIHHVCIQVTLIGLTVLHSPPITSLVQTSYKDHMNARSLSFVHHTLSSL